MRRVYLETSVWGMGMTLDEYLAEVDKWKERARRRTARLSAAERRKHYEETLAWLARKIGRPLKKAAVSEERIAHRS